ncbi:Uncharacterised protein [Burkholderia pseudomallei]|nr:Uncharacterised protein [Burkholderia pseudomallei]
MDEREMFEAWRKSLMAHPNLMKDADGYYEDYDTQIAWSSWQAARRTTPDREAIIEECAKVCDEDADDKWNLYKGQHPYTGRESGRADPYVEGRADGASVCADRIRALKTVPTSDKGGA